MVPFRPSFSLWPPPQFLGQSSQGLAAWIVDRDASRRDKHHVARDMAVQRIVDTHHDKYGKTIKPANPKYFIVQEDDVLV